jgi:hypothetical protein
LSGIAAAGGRPNTTTLTGAAEINGGDADGSGTATIWTNVGLSQVCWDIQVSGIVLPALAAHVHAAPAGVNGGIVVPLSAPDASGHASGCATADQALVKAIAKDSSNYYVNVHDTNFPGGALRGQL